MCICSHLWISKNSDSCRVWRAATPYLWVAVPERYSDEDFIVNVMIDKAHVAFTPGSFFGDNGRGYFRTTLFMTIDKIEEALDRMSKVRW